MHTYESLCDVNNVSGIRGSLKTRNKLSLGSGIVCVGLKRIFCEPRNLRNIATSLDNFDSI